jgi:hypothetical protein
MVVIMTELQDFCQEPRTMEELIDGGFPRTKIYNAVKRGELVNANSKDAWGRKQRGKGLFVSAVTPVPYNATLLVAAWNNQLTTQGETHV